MSIADKLRNKFTATTAATTAARPAAKKAPKPSGVSKYAGKGLAQRRAPQPPPGEYQFRIADVDIRPSQKGGPDTCFVKLLAEVAEDDALVGQEFVLLQQIPGRFDKGVTELNSLACAVLGLTIEEYGAAGDFAIIERDAGEVTGLDDDAPSLIGRSVYAAVTRGNDVLKDGVATGDFYRQYNWTACEDA